MEVLSVAFLGISHEAATRRRFSSLGSWMDQGKYQSVARSHCSIEQIQGLEEQNGT